MADGEKWIGHARLLAEVPSTIGKCIKFQKELDSRRSPGPGSLAPGTVFTYPTVYRSTLPRMLLCPFIYITITFVN